MTAKIVRELLDNGIHLHVDGENIRYKAIRGRISEVQKERIRKNKQSIIRYLDTLGKITHMQESEEYIPLAPIERTSREGNLKLSYAQQRLWFVDQLELNSAQYNIPCILRFKGKLSIDALKNALYQILNRHEVLRTGFIEEGGVPYQVVKNEYDLPITIYDLSTLNTVEQQDEIERLIEEEANQAFNLKSDLMLRMRLLVLSATSHVALFTMHHIASDGWSLAILQKEFSRLYQVCSQNESGPFPALKFQYADYAEWQRKWLHGELLDKELIYWNEKLSGMPNLHGLPLDNPRPDHQTFAAKSHFSSIDAATMDSLKELCVKFDVTLYMMLETAFAVLLSRYSNETDIIVGTATAGRMHQDIESLIGFFVNDLVVRTNLSGNPTFKELLLLNKQTILDGYTHQYVPFEMLVEKLNPERSLRHHPLFQIKMDLRNDERLEFVLDNEVSMEVVVTEWSHTRYDLYLNINDTGTGLDIFWVYDQALFESSSIEQMSLCFSTLLESIVETLGSTNEQGFRSLEILTDSARHQQLIEWNNTKIEYASNMCIHELIEANAKKMPNSIAVSYETLQLSYHELNERANRLAHYLIEQGVGPDVIVALCIENSLEMIVGLLGVLKSGAAYLPLDPDYPTARLKYMLSDSGVELVLTSQHLLSELELGDCKVIPLDENLLELFAGHHSVANVSGNTSRVDSSNLAYVIYTSGSTSNPKGVLINHDSLVKSTLSRSRTYDQLPSAFLLLSSYAFDSSLAGIFWTLSSGGKLCIASSGDALDPARIETLLIREQVSHLLALPRVYFNILQGGHVAPDSMQVVIVAGEICPKSLVDLHLASKHWSDCRLVNEYGPTEGCVWSTSFDCSNALTNSVPIGSAAPHAKLFVLDEDYRLLPVGVKGELCIAGFGLSRGYLNQPVLTAEKFVSNPFCNEETEKLYKTGDLVRWLPEGNLAFLGRLDDQVKVRGFRIELGEIESQLRNLDGVQDSVVLFREIAGQDNSLVAYILSELLQENDEILEHQKARLVTGYKTQLVKALPDYMVPNAYIFLNEFPLTPTGKIDKKSLPVPSEQDLLKNQYVPAGNEIEEKLCVLWQEVLKLDQVGTLDNFFSLGGHSLLATRLISLVRENFGVEIPVRALFESPTIKDFSGVLASAADSTDLVLPSILKANRSDRLPLSYAQQRLWVIDQLGSGSVQYNVPGRIQLQGRLKVKAFKKALNSLLDRHEVLRTQFSVDSVGPYQVIANDYELPLVQHDLSNLDEPLRRLEVVRLSEEEASRPFDLSAELMLRVQLIKLSQSDHVVLYTMHHIASDGWSMGVLQSEFSALYEAFGDKRENPLLPLTVQYADYAMWQRSWLQGKVLSEQREYWKTQLAGAPLLHNLPLDRPRPAEQGFEGGAYLQVLDENVLNKIKLICAQHGVTLFMFLETAFAVLLCRYSGSEDIVVGSPIAGRTHKEVEGLIGFFVNTLVIRSDLSGSPKFSDLLVTNKQTILNSYTYQHIPFEMLVEELRLERRSNHNPLFQISFELRSMEEASQNLSGLQGSSFEDAEGGVRTRFDLEGHGEEDGNKLWFNWVYNIDLYDGETIERLVTNFGLLLDSIVRSFGKIGEPCIHSLDLLNEGERYKQLVEWNDTTTSFPKDKCIHELLEEQVEQYPNHLAVVYEGVSLSYAELNKRSNQLAHYLIAHGVTPETFVGLYIERSLEMIVGLFGILKAGGVYVPMDPNYPAVRLNYILKDSGAKLILTQSNLLDTPIIEQHDHICLDDEDVSSMLIKCSAENPNKQHMSLESRHLAYVIYTSGSTGQPKGIMIRHYSVVNLAFNLFSTLSQHKNSTKKCWAWNASFSFDASVQGISQLILGTTLVIIPEEVRREANKLYQFFDRHDIGYWDCTPVQLQQVLNISTKDLPVIVVGGEPLGDVLWNRLVELSEKQGVIAFNAYGPSETCVDATLCPITTEFARESLGKLLGNTQAYVLSKAGMLAPIGVQGELYLGGIGLAKGYLGQEDLTAEKFVANPFSDNLAELLYRTGDLVRWLPDGNLEYLGRIDDQVKVGGFRIELGEIESVLVAQESLNNAVVTVRTLDNDDKQLVAHVCPSKTYLDAMASRNSSSDLQRWTTVFDEQYSSVPVVEETDLNFTGWNSSYTGEAVEIGQMEEWLSGTVDRIEAMAPKHLLEIGCGTGLLLYRYGGYCESVHALDISSAALSGVRQELDARGWSHVELQQGDALSTEGLVDKQFDAVVINSVVQYFPNRLYFNQVLEQLLRCVAPGCQIFIGDVRNLDLLTAHAAAVEKSQLTQSTSVSVLASRVQRRIQQEPELLISPGYFHQLAEDYAEISRVDIMVKRGVGDNEMLRYRYDVVLTVGGEAEEIGTRSLPWSDFTTNQSLRDRLTEGAEECFAVSSIPNYRISEDVELSTGLSEWEGVRMVYPPEEAGGLSADAIVQVDELESVLQQAEQCGYRVGVSWSQARLDCVDVIFSRGELPEVRSKHAYTGLYQTNYPQLLSIGHELSIELKGELEKSLPDYMVPSVYVVLEQLPLTPNGKVDKKALPLPEESDLKREIYVEAVTEYENILAAIWKSVLSVERVGLNDDFFLLGGHSILLLDLMNKIREVGFDIALTPLFKYSTLKSMAAQLEKSSALLPINKGCVKLRGGSNLTPLFLVHEYTGYVFGYAAMVQDLESGIPVYGLQTSGVFGPDTYEYLAGEHVKEMQQVQPEGPYRIAGWSLGGIVAFEIATQLIRNGHCVEFLGVIDSNFPSGEDHEINRMNDVSAVLSIFSEFTAEADEHLMSQLTAATDLEELYEKVTTLELLAPNITLEIIRHRLHKERKTYKFGRNYKPEVLTIPTYLFLSNEDSERYMSTAADWKRHLGDAVSVYSIEGTHKTMMQQPNVRKIAELFSKALNR